ncbi:MAG TPA: hypothetical protein VGJ60_06840 [Chloroflexota bacterium]
MSTTPAQRGAQLQPVVRDDDDDLVELAPIDRFQLLDVYAKGVVKERDGGARIDALATISAGDRGPDKDGRPGTPRVSRDGTIMLHDADNRAPGLKAALAETNNKRLTIAVGFDDPDLFLQQRFVCYTATALKVYGDQFRLMEIVTRGQTAQHLVHEAGTPRYDELVADCKVSASLYFVLADWDQDNKPRVLMPDGLGFYRLRTTSRHSLRNILGTLRYLSRFTGGRLAGVPMELQLTYREVSDPFGMKRNIPTWSLAMKPPHGIVLDTRNFAPLVQQALAEGKALHVPDPNGKALMAPRAETWETAAVEGPEEFEPDDADIARLMAGDAPADYDYWRRAWFGAVGGSRYADKAGRAEWMLAYTDNETNSLAAWLKGVTNADAERMLAAVTDTLAREANGTAQPADASRAQRYTEIFGDDTNDQASIDAATRRSRPQTADDDEEIDPGDMGEGGWAEAAARDEADGLDPDVGECELCGVVTKLVMANQDDEDSQLVCADREACTERCEDLARQDEQQKLLDRWLTEMRQRISSSVHKDVAEYDRRKAVGMLIQQATANDSLASRGLLQALIDTTSLAKLTTGACDVIEAEALKPEWLEMVKLVVAKQATEPASA